MSMHATEAAPQVEWLDDLLRGAALQAVRVPDVHTLVLKLRKPGRNIHLLLSVAPGLARIHTVVTPEPARKTPLALQGLLRKELHGRVRAVELVDGDRIVRVRIAERSVVASFVRTDTDLFLLDEDDRVLGSALGTRTRGAAWASPPPRGESPPDRFAGLQGEARDDAIRRHFDELAVRNRVRDVNRRLKARRKVVVRTVARREAEAGRADEAAQLQRTGDLLQSSFHRLRRGMTDIELEDYETGRPRVIELDPADTPQQNVERWYRRARKARRSGELALTRLADAEEEAAHLDEALRLLEEGRVSEAEAFAPPPRRRGKRGPSSRRLPYRQFFTSGGVELRVGRSARENDDLTFRHSKGNDVWLHVRGRPGAHVVIRDAGPSPPTELLVLGAQLALKHSGIMDGAREEVAWTRVKHVRKPRGMAAGAVLVGSEKVLYVEANAEVLDALARVRA